jgi:hypothetical protein
MGDSMSTIINATTTNGVVIQPDNSGSLVLQTNSGTTALTISTSQNATFAAQATIPTINLTGGQIVFPATQSASANANTLDDYEEGTWTPTVVTNSGTATAYSDLVGNYTKIGNLVYVRGSVRPSNGTFGASSNCKIGGLPFSGTTSAPRGGTMSGVNSSNYTTNQTAIGAVEGTEIPFAMNVAITSANLFSFSGCYLV